jgi:hypothetical protein
MDAKKTAARPLKAVKPEKRKNSKEIDEMMQQVADDPGLIQSLVHTLGEKSVARLKAANKLQLVSQADPALLYPHFEVFVKLLESDSNVLLWNAAIILSYLVKVDANKHFDSIFKGYYAHLWDGKLVTAANILAASGRIARCRPDLACRITAEMLKVDEIPMPTSECREVARGHVLNSLAEYIDLVKDNQPAEDFIFRCTSSHRPAVNKKARELKCYLDSM